MSKALHWLKTSHHQEIQDNSAFVLQGLASLQSASQEVVASSGIEIILEVMKTAKPALCLALGNALLALSYFDNQKLAIAKAGGVQILVDLLNSPEVDVQRSVPPILGSLAFNDAICAEISQKGAIPHLVNNLKSTNKKLQCAAVDAIANLSSEESTRAVMAENNAVEPLLTILSSVKVPVTQECVCRTLLNMASDEKYIPNLLSAGIINKIKPLTKSEDKEIKKNAVSTLRNLSGLDTSIDSFHHDEATATLIEVLQNNPSTEQDIIKPALEALVNLSADDRIPIEITKVTDGVSAIVDFLSNPNPEFQAYASVIICNIARNQDILYTIGKRAIAELLNMVKTSNEFGQTQAAAALHYMAQQDSNRVEMCNAENFLNLFDLLTKHDEAARNASWTLEQLVANAQCAMSIVNKYGMPELVKLLSSSNEHVKNAALFVIYKALRTDLNLRISIKDAGASPALQQIAKTDDKRSASFASYMLQVLSK